MKFSPIAIALVVLSAGRAEGQSVRLRIVDDSDGAPLAEAFVILADTSGKRVAAGLTSSVGWVQMSAPPGTYFVRVERLGYETEVASKLEIAPNGAIVQTIRIANRPLRLAALDADVDQRCRIERELGARTAALWEEIRKVLRLAVDQSAGPYHFIVDETRLRLTPDLRLVSRSDSSTAIVRDGSPYESAPLNDLIQNGFIQQLEPDTWTSFAPDAAALLSNEFIDRSCFRWVERREDRLVGLEWKPRTRPAVPWIMGTLWVDAETYRLSHIEFKYVESPWPVAAENAGGEVWFSRLASGEWIVSHWWMRSPVINAHRQILNRMPVVSYSVSRYIERRRTVLKAVDRAGNEVFVR